MQVEHIILPYCWCCGSRFTDSAPPGPANREVHHIIPQAYGGRDGATVTLCDTHHQKLHKIAVCMKTKAPHFSLVSEEPPEVVKKLYFLASRVYNAQQATKNDPNKTAVAVLELGRRHRVMIEQLQKVYPKAKSREAVLLAGLENLYKKHFT